MTATTTPLAAAPVGARPRAGLRGLPWLVLRQHRATVWCAASTLAALVVGLLWLRNGMDDFIDSRAIRDACITSADCPTAQATVDYFRNTAGDLLHYLGYPLRLLPLVAGMFVAGPVVARELESGTYKLAWTQSVSPLRWFAVKLSVPAVAVLAGGSLLSAAYTWAWQAVPEVLLPGQAWYLSFDMLGPAPVAHALLGIAVGALAGLLVKRTMRAMGAALVGYLVLTGALLDALRPHLVSPVTQLSAEVPGLIRDRTWILERGIVTRTGEHLAEPHCGVGVSPEQCLARHDGAGWYLDFHPYGNFWPLQWAEAGVSLALAAVVTAVAVRLLRRMYR
ncbi:ABC transporter permease [Streptomyces sp. NPDC001404]|uniref:ABC transporter permease n=1 Tax=Streptomyces sp. NPDC001404 TaxID=3364571 RepID=UPI0036A04A6F